MGCRRFAAAHAAARNAAAAGVAERSTWQVSDWFTAVPTPSVPGEGAGPGRGPGPGPGPELGSFDVITSNPPYIALDEWPSLPVTVQRYVSSDPCSRCLRAYLLLAASPHPRYEPRLALDGGTDGLDAYRAIAAQAPAYMAPSTVLVVEVGIRQGQSVRCCALVPAQLRPSNLIPNHPLRRSLGPGQGHHAAARPHLHRHARGPRRLRALSRLSSHHSPVMYSLCTAARGEGRVGRRRRLGGVGRGDSKGSSLCMVCSCAVKAP